MFLRKFVLLLTATVVIVISTSAEDRGELACFRSCENGDSRICYYRFLVEWYYTMSKACYNCPYNITDCSRPDCVAANGVEKAILTVNRRIPGPSIQVCENDTVIVDIVNRASSESTSIHWHGIHHGPYTEEGVEWAGSQYMDGVPEVTQCPIEPRSTFRYRWRASPSGTHFWHSHSGLQRADGLHGMLIVRKSKDLEPHRELYDEDLFEHGLIVSDWLSELSLQKFLAHHHGTGNNKPQSILINGKGRYQEYNGTFTPLQVIVVRRGQRYRLRLASTGVLNCPLRLSIEMHDMLVIATDGQPVKPIFVQSMVVYAGERFDVVITANQTVDNYWIKAQGLLDCDARFTMASQVAILRYEGAPDRDPTGDVTYSSMDPVGKQLNPLNSGTNGGNISIVDLDSLLPDDRTSEETCDVKFYLPYDFNPIDNLHFHDPSLYPFRSVKSSSQLYTPQINGISLSMPDAPLLSQLSSTSPSRFCNHTHISKNCSREYCECIYLLRIPLGATVELVLIDEGFPYEANHPIHIHGLKFRVVAMQRIGTNVTAQHVRHLDETGKIQRKLKYAVVKDVVTVPDGGFAVIRFVASNPGFWLLHCHNVFHVEIGMGLILQVGGLLDLPPVPENFPRCGTWLQDSSSHQVNNVRVARSSSSLSVFLLDYKKIIILVSVLRTALALIPVYPVVLE